MGFTRVKEENVFRLEKKKSIFFFSFSLLHERGMKDAVVVEIHCDSFLSQAFLSQDVFLLYKFCGTGKRILSYIMDCRVAGAKNCNTTNTAATFNNTANLVDFQTF